MRRPVVGVATALLISAGSGFLVAIACFLAGQIVASMTSGVCTMLLGLAMQTLRAFCKLLWIQNDLIVRHYQAA